MNFSQSPNDGISDSWFYKYVLGIILEHWPGFEKFTIHPVIMNELNFAQGEYNSVKGMIRSAWKKETGFYFIKDHNTRKFTCHSLHSDKKCKKHN